MSSLSPPSPPIPDPSEEALVRQRLTVTGCVQGIGFRPYVYRLALEVGILGSVRNHPQGVTIDVQAPESGVYLFLQRLQNELPPLARIDSLTREELLPDRLLEEFVIAPSDCDGAATSIILPDLATCEACLQEIRDPGNRRYRYPFTNCTHCGPRFSIIQSLPYDRSRTTMAHFLQCDECATEYHNPADRRFHAQPNACPVCGPHLELLSSEGTVLATHGEVIPKVIRRIHAGAIVAARGLGGFHLLVDARNQQAVIRLRKRKQRFEKPFALMVPDVQAAHALCRITPAEETLLQSHSAPIVLLPRNPDSTAPLADAVVGHNPDLGLMLPYTPLHHILMQDLDHPIVATSGNRSDEPICIDNSEALTRLQGIADVFLVHNRPIVRPVDDSVVRMVADHPQVLRRSRGYAPLPVTAPETGSPMLAVGGHLKNTVALASGPHMILSQHIGDLESPESLRAFEEVQRTLQQAYPAPPECILHDLHPDYQSTRWAQARGLPTRAVQHHHAHVLSGMAEHRLEGPVLGIAWDGTGFGTDGTIWGMEFLHVEGDTFERVATLSPFPLPGGERAIRSIARVALGLLWACYGEDELHNQALPPVRAIKETERRMIQQMLETDLNAPRTSSLGRLFDAVASLIGLRQQVSYEGQAAIELEWEARRVPDLEGLSPYPVRLQETLQPSDSTRARWHITPEPLLRILLDDVQASVPQPRMAARFHLALVDALMQVVRQQPLTRIVLSGGCFQNRILLEQSIHTLRSRGYDVYWNQNVPTNDGGLALGQLAYGACIQQPRSHSSCV